MVISRTHKFAFIHVPKVAGSSISQALNDFGVLHVEGTKHMTLQEIEVRWSLKGFTIFGFVRNPWDRFYSFYTYMMIRGRLPADVESLDDFVGVLKKGNRRVTEWRTLFYNQCDFFKSSKGYEPIVCRYEALQGEWTYLKVGLDLDLPKLKHLNKFSRKDVKWRNAYTSYSKQFVADHYKRDIKQYAYEFE